MFRLSTWLTLGVLVALMTGWWLKGAPLAQSKTAGWSEFGSWGWGSMKTTSASGKPEKAEDAAPENDTLKAFDELASKGIDIEVPELKEEPEPAAVAEAPENKGVPHPDPWPVATHVPDWGATMKVRIANADVEVDSAAAEVTTAAEESGGGTSDALPWPIAQDVPNWGDTMKVRIAADESAGADAGTESGRGSMTVLEASETTSIPWPIATEVPNWHDVMKVRGPDAEEASAVAEESSVIETADASAAAGEPVATGVPHPFPWPIAQESVTWDIGPRVEAGEEPSAAVAATDTAAPSGDAASSDAATASASVAVGVPHPFPWPIAQESVKWDNGPRMAAAPAASTEAERRGALSNEQKSCEDELRRVYASGTILFKLNSAELDANSAGTLSRLAKAAKACAKARIRVEGHTDSSGDDAYNLSLSQRRAQAIVSALKKAGVASGALAAQGLGKAKPIAPNDTEENMAKNRRIEFVVE